MVPAAHALHRLLGAERQILRLRQLTVAHVRAAATANRQRQQIQLLQQAGVSTSCLVAHQQEATHTQQHALHQHKQQQQSPQLHQLGSPVLSGQAWAVAPPATLCRQLLHTAWQPQHNWQQHKTYQQQAWGSWQQQPQQQSWQQRYTLQHQAWRPWQRQQQQQQQRGLHLAPPFLVEDYVPAAVTTYRLGRMPAKIKAAEKELSDCRVCPRDCGVDRLAGKLGMCGVGRTVLVSTVAPHFAEEAPLQGWNGSGTVFFSMCNLRCVFCQNWDISQKRSGFELTGSELADWIIKLQDFGNCHNINFVTPEHVAPQVVEAIAAAVDKGLRVPIIYNTSAYDGLPSLALMDGLVDIYMPDFKFVTPESGQRYAKARDYADVAKAAIKEMHRQVGDLVFSPDGLAKRGLLLRHLVMPGLLDEGKAILEWVVQELGRDTYVHIMEQYSPRHLVGSGEHRSRDGWTSYKEINRPVSSEEVQQLRQYARSIGLWRFEEAPRYEAGEMAG